MHAPSPWLAIAMQAAFYLVTVVAMLATMRQIVRGLQDGVKDLKEWASKVDDFTRESATDRAKINQRLDVVERDERLLKDLNDGMVRVQVQQEHTEKSVEKMVREIAGIHRAIANLASGQTRITTIENGQ